MSVIYSYSLRLQVCTEHKRGDVGVASSYYDIYFRSPKAAYKRKLNAAKQTEDMINYLTKMLRYDESLTFEKKN